MGENFAIESSFEYRGIHYGPGEKVPEGMTNEEKEQLFRRGRLAKVNGEKISRFQREIELDDGQIDVLLTQPLAVIEATLRNSSFSEKTIGKVSIAAIQKNLPQISKILKEKLNSAKTPKVKVSGDESKEFKCSCGKKFKNARALNMHKVGSKHK